jgi:hypothetical protein
MVETKQRDWLDYLDIFGKVIASVALPLALFFAGRVIADQQAINEDLRRREDRVTDLLRYLGSKEPKERLLGISVLRGIGGNGKLPPELSSALVEIALTDDDISAKNAAFGAYDAQAVKPAPIDSSPTDSQPAPPPPPAVVRGAQLPARLYLNIVEENQREGAKALSARVARDDLVVPGIERVAKARLQRNELRYFWPDDEAEAERIAATLRQLEVPVSVVFPERFAKSGRPRHFELWLKPKSS